MIKIIITWGLWYLWAIASAEFIKKWFDVYIVDNLQNSNHKTFEKLLKLKKQSQVVKFLQLDILDTAKLTVRFEEISKKWNPVVYHFAGLKSVEEGEILQDEYYACNVLWTKSVLTAMKNTWINKIVYSSSAAVYWLWNWKKFKESDEMDPVNFYGKTKKMAEELIRNELIENKFNFSAVILRYFNPIWNSLDWEFWDNPNVKRNIIPVLTEKINKWEAFQIFGSDYDTKDGTCVRDYIDVNELIDAHIWCLRHLKRGVQTINIWNGKWLSVLELWNKIQNILKKSVKFEFSNRRVWDVPYLVCDTSVRDNLPALNWKKIPIEKTLENIVKYNINRG